MSTSFVVKVDSTCSCGCGGLNVVLMDDERDEAFIEKGSLPADVSRALANGAEPSYVVTRCQKADAKLYVEQTLARGSYYVRNLKGDKVTMVCPLVGRRIFPATLRRRLYLTYKRSRRKVSA